MDGTRQSRGADRWRDLFARPPYAGLWVAAVLTALLAVAGLVAGRRDAPEMAAAPPPAPAQPAETAAVSPQPRREEPEPEVTVRSLPSDSPRSTEREEEEPGVSVRVTTPTPPPPVRGPDVSPEASPDPPDGEVAVPETISVPPEPEPVPERQASSSSRPPAPPARPRERTGTVRIYFDADSSTFAGRRERLPLSVEVYVDGEKRLETDDPEKREFSIRRLSPGEHELRIVPRVGDAPPDPRWVLVEIDPDGENRYRAVLRKSDGMSRISKFTRRD